jgi:hypothetical protein
MSLSILTGEMHVELICLQKSVDGDPKVQKHTLRCDLDFTEHAWLNGTDHHFIEANGT